MGWWLVIDMSKLTDWMHDDITWCMDSDCPHRGCYRNQIHMRDPTGIHSYAMFHGTDLCPLTPAKVIFLDVDGVLNDMNSKSRVSPMIVGIDKAHVRLLKYIVDQTGAGIVLTSTWKRDWEPHRRSTEQPTHAGKYLANKLFDFGLKPIDKTKDHEEDRGDGIRLWLKEHPSVKNFVIIDDDVFPDYSGDLWPHTVFTFWQRGLRKEDADDAIKILNRGE